MARYDLDQAIGFWLHLTHNRVRHRSEPLFQAYGISPEQWAILVRLWDRDDRSQTELAEATFRDYPSISRMISGLEERGYVVRARDLSDARSHRIVLTKAGRDLETELVPKVRSFVARFVRGVSRQDMDVTLSTLRRLYDNLD